VDQSAGRLTDTDDWFVRFSRWELIYAVGWLVGIALAWYSRDSTDVDGKIAITCLIVAMAVWWRLFGRRLAVTESEVPTWRGIAYLAGVLALFVPVVALVPDCTWMLFGLCPQCYMFRPTWRALGWVGALNAAPPIVILVRYGFGTPFSTQIVDAVGIVVLSHFIGSTIDGIVRESMLRGALIEELAASRAEVATLSREAGVTEERERLAGEIHDTLAQGFTSILTLVQAATAILRDDPDRATGHLRLAADTARDNLGEARALVGALAPAALGTGTLVDALRRQATRVRDESGIDVGIETSGDVGSLPMSVEVVLLRATQEALTNVRKHSGAATATVRLTVTGPAAVLVVADDGVGFDPAAPSTGFGMAAMRSRATQVGGSVSVTSGPEHGGTTLRVEVPR
jgi:signal transduction histidine kinase